MSDFAKHLLGVGEKPLTYNLTPLEMQQCRLIAQRYKELVEHNSKCKLRIDDWLVCMDVATCHCNGNFLHLQNLLDAPGQVFYDTVSYITERIDRHTGRINGTAPMFSVVLN